MKKNLVAGLVFAFAVSLSGVSFAADAAAPKAEAKAEVKTEKKAAKKKVVKKAVKAKKDEAAK